MMDNARTLWTHHTLSVALALGDRRQYPRLSRVDIVYAAVLEHPLNELFDLRLQRLIGDRLSEESEELPIGALETPQQFVPDEFAGNPFAGNLGGAVRPAHERAYDIRYIKPYRWLNLRYSRVSLHARYYRVSAIFSRES